MNLVTVNSDITAGENSYLANEGVLYSRTQISKQRYYQNINVGCKIAIHSKYFVISY